MKFKDVQNVVKMLHSLEPQDYNLVDVNGENYSNDYDSHDDFLIGNIYLKMNSSRSINIIVNRVGCDLSDSVMDWTFLQQQVCLIYICVTKILKIKNCVVQVFSSGYSWIKDQIFKLSKDTSMSSKILI
jgi:hypothetical protein